MKRKNQVILGVISAAADTALIFVSYLLALELRFRVMDGYVSIAMNSRTFLALIFLYALTAVLCYAAVHLYQPFRVRRFWRDAGAVLIVNTMCALVLTAVLFTLKIIDFSRGTLFMFWGISSFLVILKMLATEKIRKNPKIRQRYLRHVIVIGNGKNALTYVRENGNHPEMGVKIDGYISRVKKQGMGRNLGKYEDLGKILAEGRYDGLVVALEPHEISFMPEILKAAEKEGTRVEMIPMYNEYYPPHPTVESVGATRLVDLRSIPLDNIALAAVKRAGDIAVSFLLLVILSPLLAAIAIGVKLSGPGPALFRQERIGKNKKPFVMLKFRSMRTDIDHNGWSTDEDPRKTKFGSLIRKFSLDELPQLWNVLTGSMSLVGPRPELPVYVQQFKEEVPLYLIRQQVRPGMTGWAQINGLRGDTPIDRRVEYDLWYIQNWTVGLDLRILIRTAFGGMINKEKLR